METKDVAKNNVATAVKPEALLIAINEETNKLLDMAFGSQNDIENQTKFVRSFVYDAVIARLKYTAQANVNAWKAAVDKGTRLHPTQTREQVITDMLASRKAKELKELADKSEVILADLK